MSPPARNPDFSQIGARASSSKGNPSSTLSLGSSSASSSSGGNSSKSGSPMLDDYIKSPASSQPWSHLKVGS